MNNSMTVTQLKNLFIKNKRRSYIWALHMEAEWAQISAFQLWAQISIIPHRSPTTTTPSLPTPRSPPRNHSPGGGIHKMKTNIHWTLSRAQHPPKKYLVGGGGRGSSCTMSLPSSLETLKTPQWIYFQVNFMFGGSEVRTAWSGLTPGFLLIPGRD